MAINDQRINELAVRLARAMGMEEQPMRPALRLVEAPSPKSERVMDSVTRESHIRLIRSLRRFYKAFGIDVVVDHALLGKGGIDDLEDSELVDLLDRIHRARECVSDGISFEDAGLLPGRCG